MIAWSSCSEGTDTRHSPVSNFAPAERQQLTIHSPQPARSRPMATRILLIYPPSRSQSHETCPTGLMLLGAVLDRAGYEVVLLDANAVAARRSIDQVVQRAAELKPDVIGISLLTPLVRDVYKLVAKLAPIGAKLLAGGPHATLVPEEPLAHGFDATVIGEGEPTIVEAVAALLGQGPKESVSGWVYRDEQGQPRHTSPRPPITDLDALPTPAWHLVDPADYGGESNQAAPLHPALIAGMPGQVLVLRWKPIWKALSVSDREEHP